MHCWEYDDPEMDTVAVDYQRVQAFVIRWGHRLTDHTEGPYDVRQVIAALVEMAERRYDAGRAHEVLDRGIDEFTQQALLRAMGCTPLSRSA